ncbi:MAG: flagellar type III secretion system pore protein FliP [Phycisphaerae bacterium]|nr:flagellar type III secretion system pore protein FliP [Phycisphaerae bacterium]
MATGGGGDEGVSGIEGWPLDAGNGLNPASILAGAARALPLGQGDASEIGAGRAGKGTRGTGLSTALNIMLVLTVITLVPSIMLMTTCFLRIIVVLGLLRQALGLQTMPPGQVILGLALVMTLLVMSPTIERIRLEAVVPYRNGEVTGYDDLWDRAKQPVRDFMFDQIEATGNWSSLYMMLDYRGVDTSRPELLTRADVDMVSLVPAYVLSELKTAFLMGFRVYLPFLVIDMVISSLLISMSMMMLPPVLVSMPFKLLLFVLVDGWTLVCGSLMRSFVTHGAVGAVGAVGGG